MSMNGVDYNKQLAKNREYFQDANKKLKDASDKRVEDTEKRAEHVTQKQRDNFIAGKNKLEEDYKTRLDHLNEKTKQSLEGNSSKYQEGLNKEREEFTQDSLMKSKNFDQRLHDIKSSYAKAYNSERNRNEDTNKKTKEKYNTDVSQLKDTLDVKLGDYQKRLSDEGKSLKDQYNRERQQLVNNQENTLNRAYTDSAEKRAELRDRISTELKRTKDVHEAENGHSKKYAADSMSNMQKGFQHRYDKMSQDYSQKSANLSKSEQKLSIKTNKENEENLSNVRKQFNDSLRQIDLEKRRNKNGSSEFQDVVNKQQGSSQESTLANKIHSLKDQLSDVQRGYEEQASGDQKAFKEDLKQMSSDATALKDRKINEANADKIVAVSTERENSLKEVNAKDTQRNLEKSQAEALLMKERNQSSDKVDSLKATFHDALKTMDEKHKASLVDVTKVSNADKTEFMKRIEKSQANDMYELKRSFSRAMDATVLDYETRLGNFKRENENLKSEMNQKISNLLHQTENQLESARNIAEGRRSADLKSHQELIDQKDHQSKANFTEMSQKYQKKIDKLQIESENKLKLITNDYESKLKELKALSVKELASKDMTYHATLDSLKKTFEAEKTRIVNAYESQIASIKEANKDQTASLANYKSIT